MKPIKLYNLGKDATFPTNNFKSFLKKLKNFMDFMMIKKYVEKLNLLPLSCTKLREASVKIKIGITVFVTKMANQKNGVNSITDPKKCFFLQKEIS